MMDLAVENNRAVRVPSCIVLLGQDILRGRDHWADRKVETSIEIKVIHR